MRRPRVLLIKSRSLATKLQGTSMPPLGLLYVAAALRSRLNAEVRVLDAFIDRGILEKTAEQVRTWRPDVVGVSALTAEAFLAQKITAAAKAEAPAVPVVFGGPYATSDPEGALASGADVAVIGEGEEAFSELAAVIVSEGRGWNAPGAADKVPGLALARGGAAVLTPPRPPIADLDSLPPPAWDLIDYRAFWKTGGMASVGIRPFLPMFTSRGCPYRCVYCHRIFGKAFRGRSPENVAEEVALIHRLGTKDIEVLDDIANFDADRFDGMLELLLRRGLSSKLSFPNAIRADIVRPESLDLLKRVGTGEVSVAVETASPRLQQLIGKNLSLEKVSRAIDMMADRRIFTRGFFMLGLPTETEEELRGTIRFACESRLHMALFFTPNPYPNTGLREMFVKAGRLPAEVNSIDFEYTAAPFNASAMSDEVYRRLYRSAFLKFHLSPSRAVRILRDGPFSWDLPLRAWRLFRNNLDSRRLRETC